VICYKVSNNCVNIKTDSHAYWQKLRRGGTPILLAVRGYSPDHPFVQVTEKLTRMVTATGYCEHFVTQWWWLCSKQLSLIRHELNEADLPSGDCSSHRRILSLLAGWPANRQICRHTQTDNEWEILDGSGRQLAFIASAHRDDLVTVCKALASSQRQYATCTASLYVCGRGVESESKSPSRGTLRLRAHTNPWLYIEPSTTRFRPVYSFLPVMLPQVCPVIMPLCCRTYSWSSSERELWWVSLHDCLTRRYNAISSLTSRKPPAMPV